MTTKSRVVPTDQGALRTATEAPLPPASNPPRRSRAGGPKPGRLKDGPDADITDAEWRWIADILGQPSIARALGSEPTSTRARDGRRLLADPRVRGALIRTAASAGRYDLCAEVLAYQAVQAASLSLDARTPQTVLALLPRGRMTATPMSRSLEARRRDGAALGDADGQTPQGADRARAQPQRDDVPRDLADIAASLSLGGAAGEGDNADQTPRDPSEARG